MHVVVYATGCRWRSIPFSFIFFSLFPLKFTLTIQNIIVVLSFTNISTLVFIFLFLIFFFLPFCQIPICFQFHHWIHNCDLLFFESDPYYFVLRRPFVNLISIFISPPQFKILGYTLFFFNFKFDLHSLHCYFCFVLDPFV
jgi:hypothetical protein